MFAGFIGICHGFGGGFLFVHVGFVGFELGLAARCEDTV
jgi:hypothetical protein